MLYVFQMFVQTGILREHLEMAYLERKKKTYADPA